jgi:hypothetical protein
MAPTPQLGHHAQFAPALLLKISMGVFLLKPLEAQPL